AVVGDPSDQHPLPAGGDDRENIGSAHIYKLEAGNWIYHKKLEASNGWGSEQGLAVGPGDNFGYSVDVDGNRIIVGALKQGVEINQPRGAAYIYEWQGGVNWSESFLQADDIVNYSEFGKKVAIYGDYALIGSPRHDNGNGTAYLFHKNGANWGAGTQISVDGVVSGGYFGSAVSLNDEFLAIGDYGLNNASGKVYLYDYKNAFQKTELLSSNIAIGDEYGIDCDLSEEHFIVGAEKTERNGNLPGREGTAYIYSMALAFGGNWTGAADTDWGNPDNWADFNVPNGATNVVIGAAAANQPFIDKMQANCKHLTIEAGATLSFGADGFLQANGDVNNAGQIAESAKSKDANPRIIVLGETLFNGAGRQDIPSGLYQDFTFQAQGDSYIT
ncbi:MAG: FG-GAP repeat protein, partial [Bacteroidales bacterium]|nr:FG-GAP repeat protein [Bacteroidales bacterium]